MLHGSAPASMSAVLVSSSSREEDRFAEGFRKHHDEGEFEHGKQTPFESAECFFEV